jgi:uncharacterized protein (TIGR02246 family)
MADRTRARALAAEGHAAGDPVGWFERLYQEAATGAVVPWDDRVVNPLLAGAVQVSPGSRVLDVGCGTGDNAAWLAAAGAVVTAFDVSPTAVALARARFPDAGIAWAVADARHLPTAWRRAFDLVTEVYTLQVLPPGPRRAAGRALASAVAPGGTLLVVARAREEAEPEGALPWPLTRAELEDLAGDGLTLVSLREVTDDESPPVRRWVARYQRQSAVEEVRAVLAAQVEAWNRGDVEAFCARCAEDVVYLSASGPRHGREALIADYRARYPDRRAMGTLAVEVASAHATREQVTLVATWALAGEVPRSGFALLGFRATVDGWVLAHDATF